MDYSNQLFQELILLKQCGIPELEVLKMATTNIYQSFDLKEFDILQKQKVANFLLVEGKPHKNIAALKGAKRIWKKGKELST
jgi:imidazolonepropionase-like amidohydrolase